MLTSVDSFFFFTNLFGSSFYEIVNHKINSSIIRIFIVIIVQIISISLSAIVVSSNFQYSSNLKFQMFLLSRSIVSYLSIIIDIIITIFWRYRLSSALNYILMYDMSTKFNEKKFLKSSLQWCRIFIIVSLIWWCIIGWVNSLTIKNHPIMSVFSHTLLYGGSSMQIIKFSVLIFLLYRRFDHLCSIITRKGIKIIHLKVC